MHFLLTLEICKHPIYSKCFLKTTLDTLKIYYQPHGTKSQNLAINLDSDDTLLMGPGTRCLSEFPIQNETEISFFNEEAYLNFKANPTYKFL